MTDQLALSLTPTRLVLRVPTRLSSTRLVWTRMPRGGVVSRPPVQSMVNVDARNYPAHTAAVRSRLAGTNHAGQIAAECPLRQHLRCRLRTLPHPPHSKPTPYCHPLHDQGDPHEPLRVPRRSPVTA